MKNLFTLPAFNKQNSVLWKISSAPSVANDAVNEEKDSTDTSAEAVVSKLGPKDEAKILESNPKTKEEKKVLDAKILAQVLKGISPETKRAVRKSASQRKAERAVRKTRRAAEREIRREKARERGLVHLAKVNKAVAAASAASAEAYASFNKKEDSNDVASMNKPTEKEIIAHVTKDISPEAKRAASNTPAAKRARAEAKQMARDKTRAIRKANVAMRAAARATGSSNEDIANN